MKLSTIVSAALCMVAMIGCSGGTSPSMTSKSDQTKNSMELASIGYAIAKPVKQGNIELIPIVSNKPITKDGEDIVFLPEAKEKGWIEITEAEMGFNGVHVKNTGQHHILLLAGDLVTGGHQDRVIAHDILIPPGEERDVEVFCVEQERSTGPTDEFSPSSQPVPHKVRREAMFAQNQDRVWSSVDSFNSSAAASPATRTVQGGLKSQQVEKHIADFQAPLLQGLLSEDNVTGFILVVDGKIDLAEVFGNTHLFRKAAPQLLKSILAQQATNLSASSSWFGKADAEKFLLESLSGKREDPKVKKMEWQGGQNLNLQTAAQNAKTIDGAFEVNGSNNLKGYELYRNSSTSKKKVLLLHGTYARP